MLVFYVINMAGWFVDWLLNHQLCAAVRLYLIKNLILLTIVCLPDYNLTKSLLQFINMWSASADLFL